MAIHQFGPTVVETAAQNPEELGFLSAVAEDQLDDLPKLAYADWLEKRDDARGPFLREFVRLAQSPQRLLPPGDEFPLPWRQIVGIWHRQKIRSLISDGCITGPYIDQAEKALLARARPTVHMLAVSADDSSLPQGVSKFGGRPDLAGRAEWPVFPGACWYSTAIFCAQLRLSDLRHTLVGRQLPADGLLSFFYLPGGTGQVLLQPEGGPFRRQDSPHDPWWDRADHYYGRQFHPLPCGALRLIEGLDLPLSAEFGALPEEFYHENSDYLYDDLTEWPPAFTHDTAHHQLLGYGGEANAYPAPDREPGARRLATFGSYHDSPHYWGDSACPYFYISDADLSAGRLERAGCFVG